MRKSFRIESKKNNGNLHVRLKGNFDGGSAWELINLVHNKYDGQGRVFIDTYELRDVSPFGCRIFQCQLDSGRLPVDRLFFKGEKGFEIAPPGCRVIVSNTQKHSCCGKGNCTATSCRCQGNHSHQQLEMAEDQEETGWETAGPAADPGPNI